MGCLDYWWLLSVFVSTSLFFFPLLFSPSSVQLLQHGSTAVMQEPDLLQVMEAAERRGLKELGEEEAQALRLLLTQVRPHTQTT